MEDIEKKMFLGTGWSFPPKFDFELKKPIMVYGQEDIEQSLIILLSTMKNERVMRPDYGSGIEKFIFETIDNSQKHFIEDLITNAVVLYEPRIDVESIQLTAKQEAIYIAIDYIIRNTNSRHNLVYPFYIEQGTNIDSYEKIY